LQFRLSGLDCCHIKLAFAASGTIGNVSIMEPIMSAGIKCVTALVLASGSLPPAGAGQPPTIDFMAARTVTAQMVVDALRHRRHGRAGRDQATGYLRGIKDGSAAVWCRKAAYSAPEVDGEIVAYLARLGRRRR
jgi:hypothetical protein